MATNQSATDSTPRGERSTGKGRRRRAAAEQRRIEQQRMGQFDEDEEEDRRLDLILAPAPRRRNRRPPRRVFLRDELDLALDEIEIDQLRYGGLNDFDVALALSLSLSDQPINPNSEPPPPPPSLRDMSYESLVELENVKCVASPALVASLDRSIFSSGGSTDSCVICQNDYVRGDEIFHLPCKHDVHEACGSEWLLNYSKLCPVCKLDVTEH